MAGMAKNGVLYPSGGVYGINDDVVSPNSGWSSQKVMNKLASIKSIMRVDEKPTITDGTITYVKDGTTYTTTDSETWFYYVIDNELYKTIFIDGVEYTKADSSVSFDDFIEKSAIAKTLDDTVTEEQVAGALVTYNMVKDKNLKTYSDFSQISTTATTLSEYIQAMPNNSIASLNLQQHTSAFIGDTKNVVNNGGNIWGTLFVQKINAGRIYLRLNQIGGGYHKGTFEATCTETAGYVLEWRKVLASEDKYFHIELNEDNAEEYMNGLNILTLPLGEYYIPKLTFGSTLLELPSRATKAGRLSVESLSSVPSKVSKNSLYEVSFVYRTFIYHDLDGRRWIRTLNTANTIGVFEKDTGWLKVCATSVPDAPKKVISFSNTNFTSDSKCAFTVCNGWCHLIMEFQSLAEKKYSWENVTDSAVVIPSPRYTGTSKFIVSTTDGNTLIISPQSGMLKLLGNSKVGTYFGSISYPVNEDWQP